MRVRTIAGMTGLGVLLWALVVRGSLAPDLGVGRRYRPLGPLRVVIAAPREVVYDVISGPYFGRTPRALEEKLEVLERGDDLVLAAHYTKTYGLTATTVETVRFERPERVHFRLVRGPVPHVVEEFVLRETADGTELEYGGELGTDLWALGEVVGRRRRADVGGDGGGVARLDQGRGRTESESTLAAWLTRRRTRRPTSARGACPAATRRARCSPSRSLWK